MNTLIKYIKNLRTDEDYQDFLNSLFTVDEIVEFENRIQIVQMLIEGYSQRETSKKLGVSIATVSRGSNELKSSKFKFLRKNWA